jgi:hypothetical protein
MLQFSDVRLTGPGPEVEMVTTSPATNVPEGSPAESGIRPSWNRPLGM